MATTRTTTSLPPGAGKLIVLGVVIVVLFSVSGCFFKSVPAGFVSVGTFFGKVQEAPYAAGMHFPINPLLQFTDYDIRERTIKEEGVGIPTQDQLTTAVDVSVQYRIDGKMAPKILTETGTDEQTINVHLLPKLRSVLREQGKTVKRAEDFFQDQTQQQLQAKIFTELRDYLQPKGIIVEAVLLRDIRLPQAILLNVERKKQAEQEVERQKAELARQEIEAQKQVVQAKAEREAAQQEAEKKKVLADAQAYEIQKINEAIAANPAYIQLEALKTLQSISKDPAAKLYFMDGNSPTPLPLMHLGDPNMLSPQPRKQ
jgi:regulator of protease activity HflC (stomatin/prohibitin superfamily)